MTRFQSVSTDPPKGLDKNMIEAETFKISERIAELQWRLHAEGKRSLLVVFQGMDGSGKDGAAKAAFGSCNPIGVNAVQFKKPTLQEFAHDFLWRVHPHAPAKGEISIFIRSHYEDVLIQRVHEWIDEKRVRARFRAINAWEQLLQEDNETTIVKCFMHISEKKQLEKLIERIEEPDKNWKHNDGDWEERKYWDQYMSAYEDVMSECNQPEWHIIPADSRWYRNYLVAKLVLETLQKMDPQYPLLDKSKITVDWQSGRS